MAVRKAEIDCLLLEWQRKGKLKGVTAKGIKTMIEGDEEDNSFLCYWEKASSRRSKNTKKVYDETIRKVLAFDSSPSFDTINLDWLIKFDRWMESTNPSANTRSIKLRCIRAIFNDAIDDGIISNYPFRKFRIRQEPTKKKALSLEQLRKLMHWDVEEYQKEYRDLFVLMVLMRGINIGDLCLLKDADVVDGRIIYSRRKTHKPYSIKIEPEIQDMINKYKGEGYLLEVMNRYKAYEDFKSRMNKGLKDIGGVKFLLHGKKEKNPLYPNLSTDWARHTFATIAANECNIDRDMVSNLLGHTVGLDVTNIYIKPDIEKMDAAARKVIDKILYDK